MEMLMPEIDEELIYKYLKNWERFDKYVNQEIALNKLYKELMPKNEDLSNILIKCSCLNDFYSTNIFDIHSMATHIYNLNIDERLKARDYRIVNEIALVMISGKLKNNYSFATKYCSHHYPKDYPIYDSYVEKVLMYYKKKDGFSDFKREDLKNYKLFIEILMDFKKFYNVEKFNLKEIDKFLWQIGKEKFNKKY